MPLVLPNQGLPSLLTWTLKIAISGVPDLVFTLFVNDLEPDQDTVFDDLERASFGGFQEQVLTRSGWTTPVIADDYAVSTWGTVPTEWTVTSNPQTVYGWAAYDPDTERLLIVERFDVERSPGVGDTLGVLPQFKFGTWVPCP